MAAARALVRVPAGQRTAAERGNRDLAKRTLKQLRELDPENADYAQMANQIVGAR
jgi:hypothetical protein